MLQDNTEHIVLLSCVLLTQSPQKLCMVMFNSVKHMFQLYENTEEEKSKGSYLEIVI